MIHITTMTAPIPSGAMEINTTSRSTNWTKGLSPFYLGPVKLYESYTAKNVENAWQFSKVYKEHVGEDGLPNAEYFKWAEKGWNDSFAHRYPMGKGARPEYSWANGIKYDYIEARKKLYFTFYAEAVQKTSAYEKLSDLYESGKTLYLRDFDGYDHRKLGMSYNDVLNDPTKKMGHAFVLGMLLEGWSCQ